MVKSRIALSLAVALLVVRAASADSFVSIPERDYATDARQQQRHPFRNRPIKHLAYPVLGFPSLVEAGGTIPLKVQLADGGVTQDWRVELVTAASPAPQRFSLAVGTSTFDAVAGLYTVEAKLPSNVAPAVYDIALVSSSLTLTQGRPDVQRNAVRVVKPGKRDFDWVHLCDCQLNDYRVTISMGRMREFLEEIRQRDPDLCVFTGDLCFGANYDDEYDAGWKFLADSGLAVFAVPGNHDAYATVVPQSGGQRVLVRDGLAYWRRYLGPLEFSFDYGPFHFAALNSAGGTPERRNSIGFFCTNYGGHVDAPSLAWLDADLAAADARGKKSLLFLHHDPGGKLVPSKKAFPIPFPQFSPQVWNDASSKNELAKITAARDVSHLFVGHSHDDDHSERIVNPGTPNARLLTTVTTTTLSVSSGGRYGYRLVRVRNDKIASVGYAGRPKDSVPFPAQGRNLQTTFSGPRDGSLARLEARIANRLLEEASARVELVVAPAPGKGLRASGGAVIEHVGVAANGAWVASVRATVPASSAVTIAIEPDPAGTGAVP